MYSYLKLETNLYTVGFIEGSSFIGRSYHRTEDEAAARVNYLNGGSKELKKFIRATVIHGCKNIECIINVGTINYIEPSGENVIFNLESGEAIEVRGTIKFWENAVNGVLL